MGVYIRTGTPWPAPRTPWANTLAYYPLNWNADDFLGNYDWVASNVTYTTLPSWLQVASFNGSNSKISIANQFLNWKSNWTVNVRCKRNDVTFFGNVINNQTNDSTGMFIDSYNWKLRSWLGGTYNSSHTWGANIWTNVVFTYSSGTYKAYINWEFYWQWPNAYTYNSWTNVTIWCRGNNSDRWWNGYISDVIFEDKARTAQDVTDYYNQTKVNYVEDYELSYNFTNKTVSLMQNDGWNMFMNSGHAIFNSNWLNTSNKNYSVMGKIENLNNIISNSNKITLSFTGSLTNTFWGRLSLYNVATSSTRSWVTWPFASNWSTEIQTTIYWTNYTDTRTVNSTMTVTTVLDFTAKTWNTTATDGYSRSGTLTDTQISNIKNNSNWFYVSVWITGSNTSWGLTSIYVLIEC